MIEITAAAVADLERVKNFLAAQNSQASVHALSTIGSAIDQLEQFPKLGKPTQDPDVRHF